MAVVEVHQQVRLLDGQRVPLGHGQVHGLHRDDPAALGKIDSGDLQDELRRSVALVVVV
jgi:hypothetical protein